MSRRRYRRIAAGLIAVAIVVAMPRAAVAQRWHFKPSSDAQAAHRLRPYLEIVHVFRKADVDAALARLGKLDGLELDAVEASLRRLEKHLAAPASDEFAVDVADVEAAVVLHTEAMMRAGVAAKPKEAELHFRTAQRTLTWLDEARTRVTDPARFPPPRFVPRDWYLAVVAFAQASWQLELARDVSERALTVWPDDPALLVAAGSVRESAADFGARLLASASDARGARPPDYERVKKGAADERMAAIDLFRRSLAASATAHEARLRLGHSLMASGDLAGAATELDRVLAESDDARLRYLALLFRGEVARRDGMPAEAERCFQLALETAPRSQAARFALAGVGNTRDAVATRALLAPAIETSADRPFTDDPFWMYGFGQPDGGVAAFSALVDAVRRN